MEMFRELVKIHSEPGPFNKPWCNVPMAKFHKLQGITINSGLAIFYWEKEVNILGHFFN
jgi:hypothetical protein